MYITKKQKARYDKLFSEKIGKYNRYKQFHEHFIRLKHNRVMTINFINAIWSYNIYQLEDA